MPKLETLELEITQSSKVSSRGIKPLATALGLLAEASNKVQNLGAVASGLKQLAEGGNGLKESAAGIRSVANAMKKLSETLSSAPGSVTGLQRIAEAMSKISEAAGGLSGTASDIREIKSASKAAAPTAAANAKAAKKQSLTYMFSEQEGISQDKYRQLTDALFSAESAGSIKDVVENFKELNRVMNEATPEEYARAIDRVKAALLSGDPQEIARYIKELGAVSKRLPSNYSNGTVTEPSEMGSVGEDTAESTEDIGKAAYVSAEKLERMKAVLASIQSESGASGVADSLKEMSRVMDETTPEQYAAALERVRAALESGNSKKITAAIKDLNKAISNLPPEADKAISDLPPEADKAAAGVRKMKVEMWKIPWGDFKKRIKESVGGLSQLFASFKRIAMYRALRTAIKMITQGFATGVKHLYAWADLVGNSFKGSMDSLATSANYLNNSLGAMVSPIIDALAPAVEVLVDKFVELINVVNQFLATVTGASSWRRAVRQQKEYEENTNDAAAAQKRLNHQLMAFDELNNITLNNPSGRGSGNKDDEVDDKSFVVEQLPDWAKDIKDAIDKGNWYEAGSLLANKINGLIDNWDAADWGKKIGQKIGNGLSFYNGLMDTTNWKGLGSKVADWLDAIIGEVSGEDLGHAIVAKFNAAIGFLAGFTADFDWSAAGTWLADVLIGAIKGVNWKNVGELVGNLASGLFAVIKAAIEELWKNKGEIGEAIGDFFSGLWGEDGKGFRDVVELSAWILGIKLAFGGLKSVFSSTFGNALTGGAAEAFSATGSAGLAVKGYMDSFAAKLGLITLVVGLTYVIATSGELNTPEKAAEKVEQENPFFNVFREGDTDAFKQGFLDALKNDPDVKAAYEANLYQWGKDSAHQDQNAALAAARKAYEQKYTGHDRGYKDPSSGWVDWQLPTFDTTQQVQALSAIEKAAVGARKKVTALPPSDDEVSIFQDRAIKMAGSNGVGKITSAAKTARAKVKQVSPDSAERVDFKNAMKSESASVNLVKTAAENAGKKVDLIGPSAGVENLFEKAMGKYGINVNKVKLAAENTGSAVDDIKPTTKEAKAFEGTTAAWKNAVDTVGTAAEQTNTKLDKTAKKRTATIGFSTSGYSSVTDKVTELQKQLNALDNKTYTAKVQMTVEAINGGTSGQQLVVHNYWGTGLTAHANGGFPTMGDLFIANEAGPELVGTINGKTAVSSNQEITGIANAVYETGEDEAALLREQNQLLRQLLAKQTTVSLAPNVAAGRWVAQASNAYRKATGG